MRRIDGFIDVEEMLQEIGINTADFDSIVKEPMIKCLDNTNNKLLIFNYQGENYYYKYDKYANIIRPYNELIASELAQDFGIPYVDYDLAILKNKKGVISKNFKKENTDYIQGNQLLLNFWKNSFNIGENNNLEDIWDALEYHYQNYPNKREIIEYLMKKIILIFVFDIIICNHDRHSENWMIIENDNNIDIAPIYDNEGMLTINSVFSMVSLTVDDMEPNLCRVIKRFQKISGEEYKNIIKEKLWIISDENLKSVFGRIEQKTNYPISETLKEHYIKSFKEHRERLERILNYIQKRDEQNERKNR